MNAQRKILTPEQLTVWRDWIRQAGRSLVVTNGCFDLLHAGHVTYLEQARQNGDALLVGLNSDESVRALKGEGRPLNSEMDRAIVLAALEAVDAVCVFQEAGADRFLAATRPDVWVKGGDYTLESLNPVERHVVESAGGRIVIIPFVPGRSTTSIVGKIRRQNF